MKKGVWYIIGVITVSLGGFLIWNGIRGKGYLPICIGIALVLIAGLLIYWVSAAITQKRVVKEIKKDYPAELEAQVMSLYEPFRLRDEHGFFFDILGEAKGNLQEVEKLSRIAQEVGFDYRLFLERIGRLH